MSHKINYAELKDFEATSVIASSVGAGYSKSLRACVINGKAEYRVKRGDDNATFKSLKTAIEYYNAL